MPRHSQEVLPISTVLRIADNRCASGCVVRNVTHSPSKPILPAELADWAELTELNAAIVESGFVIAHGQDKGSAATAQDVSMGLPGTCRTVSGAPVDSFDGWMALPPCGRQGSSSRTVQRYPAADEMADLLPSSCIG